MTTLPVSDLVPSWKGGLIPSAYEALVEGLRQERARFKSSRYIALSYVAEMHYDQDLKRIHFEAGFEDVEDTTIYCTQILQQRKREALIRIGPKSASWQPSPEGNVRNPFADSRIQRVGYEGLNDGSNYYSVDLWVGILEIKIGDPLTADDLAGMQNASELQRYLIEVGTVAPDLLSGR